MRTRRKRFLNECITVDPGLNTGVALWSGDSHPRVTQLSVPKEHARASRVVRALALGDEMRKFVEKYQRRIKYAVIEDVSLWWGRDVFTRHHKLGKCYLIPVKSDWTTSIVAARKGHTFFVAHIIGIYIQVLFEFGILTKTVPVHQWKGNRSKKKVEELIYKVNGIKYASDHLSDAVGLGFSETKVLYA